jgi:hypothetical protein
MSKDITYSTCWFNIKSKFPDIKYFQWIHNFKYIASFNQFYLVIYTNPESLSNLIQSGINKLTNVKIVVINWTDFYGYKYKDYWIKNKEKALVIHEKEWDWKLNMIWSEKISFVRNTIVSNYFHETPYYGWCDIGYFRNRPNDLHVSKLTGWSKHCAFDKEKIHYGWIDKLGIAGGFFITDKQNIVWLFHHYYWMLESCFNKSEYVKDDQQILLKCLEANKDKFQLYYETVPKYDSWFMFQRILY